MHLERRPLGGSRLVRDYLAGRDEAASFFAGSPFQIESYKRRARQLDGSVTEAALARLEPVIRPTGKSARQLLARAIAGRGLFVTTGQQPGLFGGPLYSLYKALTAVRLADTLSAHLGRPVMPLFWVASEDHDWHEANQSHLIDTTNQLRRIALDAAPPGPPLSLARIPLGPPVNDALDHLEASLPANDFRDRWMELARTCYAPDATMASAFGDFLAALLRDLPLGIVDAANPGLKRLSRPLLRAEAEDPQASAEALRECGDRLERLGYAHQVPLIPGAANLFVESGTGRDRLQHQGGRLTLRRSGAAIAQRRVIEIIEGTAARDPQPAWQGNSPGKGNRHPEGRRPRDQVSPNVLLRPVVESFVFPNLAYVGGPGELAYFAQTGGLFARHGLGMPVVAPRASLVALETRVARILNKHALAIDEIKPGSASLSRFARDQVPEAAAEAMTRWRNAVHEHATELKGLAVEIDPVLAGAVTRARNGGLGALGVLQKKLVRAVKRRHEITWSQLSRAQLHLWPGGKPQDRIVGPLQYLVRYGDDFIAMARNQTRVEPLPPRP